MTPAPDASGTSLFEEKSRLGKEKMSRPGSKAGKLTLPQLRELEASKEKDAVLSYGRVKELWARMLAGDMQADREWMHESESLVESFRETRALFLTTRVSTSGRIFSFVYRTIFYSPSPTAGGFPWNVPSREEA